MLRLARLLVVLLLVVVSLGVPARPAVAAPTDLFFSEYVEGTSNNKALELFNGTGVPIDLAAGAYAVEMYFNGSSTVGLTINLTGMVAAGDVFVLAQSSANATILAQADQTNGAGWFNGDDAVVLRKGGAAGSVVDSIGQVGIDPGTEWGTSLTSTMDNSLRRKSAVMAGDANIGDGFDPAVEWDGFATDASDGLGNHSTGGPINQTIVPTCPATLVTPSGTAGSANLSATDADGVVTSASITSAPVAGVSLGGVMPAGAIGGTLTAALNVADSTAGGAYSVTVQFANTDSTPQTVSCIVAVTVASAAPPARIREIQGAAHISPKNGQAVGSVPGIVTAVRSNGFYMQDPAPDADPATSEGIFVFTSSAPGRAVGDSVLVTGVASEFRPGGATSTNLTTTQIGGSSATPLSVALVSTGNPLPAATVIGVGGRVPPTQVIDDDAVGGDVENPATPFDPASDGIDFYESLEGMRVQIDNAVAVGPTSLFGSAAPALCTTPGNNCEIPVLAAGGSGAGLRTAHGGIVVRPADFNPERIILNNVLNSSAPSPMPDVSVGDAFPGAIVGVIDYSFGNFKLFPTSALPAVQSGGLQRETLTFPAPSANQLNVAAFNVENLDPGDGPAKFNALAEVIANRLKSPDIVAIEEIQDDNGPANDAVVAAAATYDLLIKAIVAAGGPTYQFRQINPVDDQDGGEPGGNIRVGFLFRVDRGLAFVDRPGGTSTAAVGVVNSSTGPELTFSPGRIDPTNCAFNAVTNCGGTTTFASRKPLAGEFLFNGRKLFIVANHFNSKGGDQPLFGHFQPPALVTEAQRELQATVLAAFVTSILTLDPNANIIVLGDLNDFEFSPPVTILEAAGLTTLVERLPADERYTYVFQGNSQVLDHIMGSRNLLITRADPQFDVVHVNAEFTEQTSDHDPGVARFTLQPTRLTLDISVPGAVTQGDELTFTLAYSVDQPTVASLESVVPAGVQFLRATGGGVYANGKVTWSLGSVTTGGSVQFIVKPFNAGTVTGAATLKDIGGSVTDTVSVVVNRRLVAYRSLAAVANEFNQDAVAGSRGGRGTVAILGLLADGKPVLLNSFDTGRKSAEIVQFTPDERSLLVTNADDREIIVVDVSDPYAPKVAKTVPIPNSGEPTSVAVHPRGVYALVTVLDPVNHLNDGKVYRFNLASLSFDGTSVTVGPHPDCMAISGNGRYALVTNEADDEAAGGPEGSVSVLTLLGPTITVTTTLVSSFNGAGFTRYADYTTVEPEYATITPDGRYGLFTIQNPANDTALGVIDLSSGKITDIKRFPTDKLGNGGSTAQAEPDGVATWRLRGIVYAATANEEDQSVSIFEINQGVATLLSATRVEEFLPVPIDANPGNSGQPNGLGNTTGAPADDPTFPFDDGEPDPEGIAVTVIGLRAVALVGLEESGAALALDVTDPNAVKSLGLIRNLSADGGEVDPTSGANRSSLTGRPEGIAIARARADLEPLRPVLECVVAHGGGRYTARFGYQNDNDAEVVSAIGPGNHFLPAPLDRGQPTLFEPGRQRDVFSVDFDGSIFTWVLGGRLAVASRWSPRCAGST